MSVSRVPLELLEPLGASCDATTRPTFRWRRLFDPTTDRRTLSSGTDDARWRLRVWDMPPRARVDSVMKRSPRLKAFVESELTSLRWPERSRELDVGAAYLWTVDAVDGRGRTLVSSSPGLFWVADPTTPFPMAQLDCCDDCSLGGDVADWIPAYGTPIIEPDRPGHFGTGVITLDGSLATGDAATLPLAPGSAIAEGKHYLVSFCARVRTKQGGARFRLSAHAAPLPDTGAHPPPAPGRSPIGESSTIDRTEWTWVFLPPWRAPADFSMLTLAAVGDGAGGVASGEVADLCIREVAGCEGVFPTMAGGPDLTFGGGAEVDLDHPPTAQVSVATVGPVESLLGTRFDDNGDDRWYRPGDACISTGGWIPDDLAEHVPWLGAAAEEAPDATTIADAVKYVVEELKDLQHAPDIEPIPFSPGGCADHDPAPHPQEPTHRDTDEHPIPFAGRDIVYVHGFVPSHVLAGIVEGDQVITSLYDGIGESGESGDPLDLGTELRTNVNRKWPLDKEPYEPGGYFRTSPRDTYWADHIEEFIDGPGHPNRYMVAGYNCTQRLPYAVHAVLHQIADAMSTGNGVEDPTKQRGTECFGEELVIITHSTGALVTQVAMAIAAQTASDPELEARYGDLSGIADRVKVHLSMHGAMAGSEAAQLAVVGAAAVGGVVVLSYAGAASKIAGLRLVSAWLAAHGEDTDSLDAFTTALAASNDAFARAGVTVPRVVFGSIAVDLSPLITRTVWTGFLSSSPVPTLTITGGHPTHGGMPGLPPLLKPTLPGLDDGVVNANSQAGSNALVSPDVYAYIPPAARIFDMGLPPIRSASFFVEQDRDAMIAAYGAVPFLSPSGMVQPVAVAPVVPRFPNVFPFVQATSEHSYTTNPGQAASTIGEYEPSGPARNYEESLVLEHPLPLTSGLVAGSITSRVVRYVRSLTVRVTVRIPVPRIGLFPPSFDIDMIALPPIDLPVWRRTYDLLGAAEVSTSATVEVDATPFGVRLTSVPPIPDPLEAALTAPGRPGEMRYAYDFVLPT